MQIKPITNDNQWFLYLRRINPTEDGLLGFMRLMIMTFPNRRWLNALPKRGRKHKKFRLMEMVWDYYQGLSPKRRYECVNRYFEVDLDKDHRFFWGYERPKTK